MMGHIFHVISLHCAPYKITRGSSLLMEKSKVEESPRLEKQKSKNKKEKNRLKEERKKEYHPLATLLVIVLSSSTLH